MNTDTQDARVAISLDYYQDGVAHSYDLPERTLPPGATSLLDIGTIIASGKPDANGKYFPLGVTFGGYHVRKIGQHIDKTITTEALVFDRRSKTFTTFYNTCCGTNGPPTFNPSFFSGPPGPLGDFLNQAIDYCSGQTIDVTGSSTFSSANTGVATVSSAGAVAGVAIGTTNSNSFLTYFQQKTVDTCVRKNASTQKPTNVITISQSPTILDISSGDTGKGVTVSVSPSSVASAVVFSQGGTTNPNSSSTASLTYNKPASFTGNDLWTISIGGTNSPSGIQNSQACVYGVCSSQLSNVAVPPQILIQMIQAEAGGTNVTTMTAVAEVARNRFSSSIFNPPYSTYQNAIPGQFATTTTSNGIEPELDIATSVFTGSSAGTFCGSLAFWTPTPSQWSIVQNALSSATTSFPSGTGAPTYDPSKWPTSSQQILFVPAVGTNASGVPYFLFLAQRSSTQAAAISATCN